VIFAGWIKKTGASSRFFLDIGIVSKKAIVPGAFNLMESGEQNWEIYSYKIIFAQDSV